MKKNKIIAALYDFYEAAQMNGGLPEKTEKGFFAALDLVKGKKKKTKAVFINERFFCENCGQAIFEYDKRCSVCNKKIKWPESEKLPFEP